MRNLALDTLAERLSSDGKISSDEALDLRRAIFPDGIVSRHEAEMLILLDARVAPDEAWAHAFVEGLVDHVLQSGEHSGHVDEASLSWLEARFGKHGALQTEVETLLKLMERSESAPERLSAFTRERLSALLSGKPIRRSETELVRRCLYAASGSGATFVTEDEARWLFALDAENDTRANDACWSDLFVKAVLNHLMGRRAPVLLQAQGMRARRDWLNDKTSSPVDALAGMFDGGLAGFKAKLVQPSDVDRLEAHYEAANDAAEQDAKLTLAEIAWTVGLTKQDGKRTANEEALLAELRKLEAA